MLRSFGVRSEWGNVRAESQKHATALKQLSPPFCGAKNMKSLRSVKRSSSWSSRSMGPRHQNSLTIAGSSLDRGVLESGEKSIACREPAGVVPTTPCSTVSFRATIVRTVIKMPIAELSSRLTMWIKTRREHRGSNCEQFIPAMACHSLLHLKPSIAGPVATRCNCFLSRGVPVNAWTDWTRQQEILRES